MNLKYKPVKLGGLFNHYHLVILPMVILVSLSWLVIIFADEIDALTSRWEFQAIFSMGLILFVGCWYFIKRITR